MRLEAELNDPNSIVLVHGLQGHPTKTLTSSETCWPRDLLPQDGPDARIMAFGYTSRLGNETPLRIRDLAKTLLESLSIDRRCTHASTRPLVFVAHSLGGLLVKKVQIPVCKKLSTCVLNDTGVSIFTSSKLSG